MAYRKGYYKKNGTYVQGHFTNTRSRSYSNKNNGCLLVILLTMTFGLAISCSESSDTSSVKDTSGSTGNSSNSNCPTKTCGDFKTQPEAQAVYNSNKICYKKLDGDGNGIACENLPKK
ncbi:excalibur calcium-binding domain-containing protein [Flavobacterium chilense]|uniref:Excalibur calcium-binding domain-containing protein n=1 Tax=Flavobacterium chilense TaxID=946677 RepID=A0A1M7JRW6_9FLAO|nr:excalibur calcium-binding domain-containing protein [Flavobacterium chilense]SHM55734.1 Excalibur calcium-binding domain-containing protein [Flavobacterium chilense]